MSQLALQLIEKEKVEKTGYLDLGCCRLRPDNPYLQDTWEALGQLTHLQTLILSNRWDRVQHHGRGVGNTNAIYDERNIISRIPVEISRLLSLEELVMNGDYGPTSWEIERIENLPSNLEDFYVNNNNIQNIENLPKGLKNLEINSNRIKRLENLPETIQRLYINNNQVQKIENLPQNLQWLDIGDNEIQQLKNLPSNLNWLNVEENQIQELGKQKLPKNLRTLIIHSNQIQRIENLPPDLRKFDIGGNQVKRIENLPKNIRSLDILYNQIERLENLPDSLQELNILSNQIQIIENLPPNLQRLDISENKIKDLTPILSYINNEENDLDEIVNSYKDLHVGQINIAENPIKNPPLEIVEQGHESIVRYFKELEKFGEIPNDTLKLILIGNTTVGKTSLANYLKNEEFDLKQDSTHGMQIIEWKPKELEGIRINIWDFGGQEYYHATHRLFLSNNAVYILLWDENTNMRGRLPLPIYIKGSKRQQTIDHDIFPREYWLDSIRYYAEDSEIFVVQNKSKKRPSISEKTRQRYNLDSNKEFHICLKKVDEYNKTGKGQRRWSSDYQIFREELINTFKALIDQQPLPGHWISIRNTILERKENYLSLTHFKEICQEVVGDALIAFDSLIVYLRDIAAVIVYCDDNEVLRNKVFIKPNWLNGNIYDILDYEVLERHGRFDMAHVVRKVRLEDAEDFVELMKKFELIFELRDAKGEYIAPQYLEDKCGNEMALKMFYEARNLQHAFTLHFTKFLPKSVMMRFLSKYGSKSEANLFWKYGICFFEEKKGVQVTYEHKYVTNNRKEDKIHVAIQDGSKCIAGVICQTLREIIDIQSNDDNVKIILHGYPPISWKDWFLNRRNPNLRAYRHLAGSDDEYLSDIPINCIEQKEKIKQENESSTTKTRQQIYQDVLNDVYNAGKSLERKPSLYVGKGEEGIRDQFLFLLEGRYKDFTTTSETHNNGGQTDIILKYTEDGTNLFIAECKIWKGPSEYLKAISQLFDRYLTWRDTRVAIILFVRNKNFSSVLQTIKEETPKHEYFLKHKFDREESSFSYEFHLEQDKNRIVQTEVMAFNFYRDKITVQ